ncbi:MULTISPECIES: alpha/beta hydrolase [unclassified Leisingera]|uniref:alpha/beta hydrolase n=1 Tax=unclassified Leisingera TaxID=2614906 RepID=UPI00031C7EEF|nr:MULTISPECIES: alpha/beta hydrolase [unclassified Leisingera]KIC16873.1 esterase [Leisingera sp. ANG-DT]KIC22097.1 esterase [Leisingera sp. ANG-S3]KIC29241.1 esterase [Leisingera sp. ANG-M6]KIC49384.1 esterase [Leisingera sp. ANG-S]KID11054.1 esterase [Leisingera sp. ANG1]
MDYERLIDEETWDFIQKTGELYPDDAVDMSIEEQRRIYNAMAREFRVPRPDVVSVEALSANGVPVRVYTAGDPTRTVLFCHGGGFVVGGLDSHDDVCAEICAQTGYRVVAVDYRLAPEHKHPAAFEDAWVVLGWVEAGYGKGIVLMGDSAGANICAAVAHHARGRCESILGQVLIYGAFGGDVNQGSYLEHAQAPMLTREDVLYYMDIRTEGEPPKDDPLFAPLSDSDFSDLPPTVLVTADCDPVRDDSRDYRDRILAAGGKAYWINEPGLIHGYLRARHSVGRARDSFERISVAVEALGQGIWPYDE